MRLTLHPKAQGYDLRSLQRIYFGTAPMPAEKLQEAMAMFGNVLRQNYGMSEATQPVLCMSPQDLAMPDATKCFQRLGSAGRPALGVEVRIGAP
jgi:fatty-acyl-CoA synthase